jgi:hypothetical protein
MTKTILPYLSAPQGRLHGIATFFDVEDCSHPSIINGNEADHAA